MPIIIRTLGLILLVLGLAGCSTLGQSFSSPDVTLASVRLGQADLTTQRFEVSFDVSNPNAITLPVRRVDYDITLGGMSLARGNTTDAFRVPANGSGSFTVNVETSLITALRELGTRVLRGGETELDYSVDGSVALDLPFVKPLPFNSSGKVSLLRD